MNLYVKIFKSGNIKKYVFHNEKVVYEAVLYKYATRTVICCSVQSGCPVGCTFCGTGNKFIANLNSNEMIEQISIILAGDTPIGRFQIMFMSMGEPLLNWLEVQKAIKELHKIYPDAELLLSTIAPNTLYKSSLIELSKNLDKVGLQFSVHKSIDSERNVLIPFKNKLSLQEISDYGKAWHKETGRMPYCNYCIDGTNNKEEDVKRLFDLFPPEVFCFTFSVVCNAEETMKDAGYHNLEAIENFQQKFLKHGYNTRIFDPEGQDDIGGGCGQLWFVQKWMKQHKGVERKSNYDRIDETV